MPDESNNPTRDVRVSDAPPPITPVRGGGYRSLTPKHPIDWRYWQYLPMEQWQACALSLNINPDNMQHHGPKFTAESFPSEAIKVGFQKRLRLLAAYAYKPEFFTSEHPGKVTLEKFAAWGLHVELDDMPPELSAMAATVPPATQVAAPAQTAATPAPVETENASGATEWKAKARAQAAEIIKRQGEKDLYPSIIDIADEIARDFRRDGVMGASGKPLSGGYIKRHALKGISSAISKQLSTTIRRGK